MPTLNPKRKPRLAATPEAQLPLRRQSLHNMVAEKLREMIVHDALQAGDKIRVGELSERLGVSPTPFREALKVLAEEGLVELTPNRGARVALFSSEEATTLFEVIAGLESLAAELAAARMTQADLAALQQLHDKMREHYKARRKDQYFDLNSLVHETIIEFARNDILAATHTRLLLRSRRGRYIAIIDPQRWDEAMDEHEELMRAFHRRDAAAAAVIWRKHLQRSGEVLAEVLRRQEQSAGASA